jgi:glutaredoxin
LAGLTVLKDGRWLFTYVDPQGQFETTDKPDIIPENVRKVVRVVDPGNTDHAAMAHVYVVDVNQLLKSGQAAATPLGREAFETAALAQLPPGANSPLSSRPAAPPPVPQGAAPLVAGAGGARANAGGHPVVTIYGTSWCGACRAARSYFQQRGIPFADKDIESDPEAAHELSEKASKVGLPTDRVPVLDVRGRLLLGFDQARVEALLGQPT